MATTTAEESRMIEAAVRAAFDDYIHPPQDLLRVIIRMDRELAERK